MSDLPDLVPLMPQHGVRLFHQSGCFEACLFNLIYLITLSHQFMCIVDQLVFLVLMFCELFLEFCFKVKESGSHLVQFLSLASKLHIEK